MKPLDYRNPFVVMQDSTYQLVDAAGNAQGLPRTGNFKIGRVVWLPSSSDIVTRDGARVLVWAEGTGTVLLSKNVLVDATRSGIGAAANAS